MPKIETKNELILKANHKFADLWKLIDNMTEDERNALFRFDDRDKNIRDVLIHLYEWHNLLLNWVEFNKEGKNKPFLPEGYNWKTYPKMNIGFWEKHQTTTYAKAKELLILSHKKTLELIGDLSEQELFSLHFPWTGNHTLGVYLNKNTISHYDWAIKKLKKHKSSFKAE